MLLSTHVFSAALYACWQCWSYPNGNSAIETALSSLHSVNDGGACRISEAESYESGNISGFTENKKGNRTRFRSVVSLMGCYYK